MTRSSPPYKCWTFVTGSLRPDDGSGGALCPGGEADSDARGSNGVPLNRLVMQRDGNLVAYDAHGAAHWASNTVGSGYFAVMQSDGNFVVYNASGGAVWASRTDGNPGAYLAIQDDGNSVIYKGSTGPALWATGI